MANRLEAPAAADMARRESSRPGKTNALELNGGALIDEYGEVSVLPLASDLARHREQGNTLPGLGWHEYANSVLSSSRGIEDTCGHRRLPHFA